MGSACTRAAECATPLVCRLGRCRVECAENRDCPLGSQCYLGPDGLGACHVAQDESCSGGCPTGLVCLGDACVRSCTSTSDCPPDGECAVATGATVGICADPRDERDASVLDASEIPDAGGSGLDASVPGASSVCVGQGYACAVRAIDGAVLCWGDAGTDASSRLGDGAFDGLAIVPASHERCSGDAVCSTRPVRVQALRRDQTRTEPMIAATQVVCGGDHACALVDGEAWCWGSNYQGQRADDDGSARPYATPTGVRGDRLFAGRYHVCALAGEELTCWGGNLYAQLWRETSAGELPALTTSGVRDATLGAYVTCVERTSGEVACAGWNWAAQLGRTESDTDWSSTPVVIGVDASHGIGAGTRFVCALGADDVPRCWGHRERGELGRAGSGYDPVPGPVTGSPSYDAIFTGPQGDQACGRQLDGTVECWGDNQRGTVGIPTSLGTVVVDPRVVPALHDATDVAFGEGSACGIAGGAVLCWGDNTLGQLGQGGYDALAHPMPTEVSLPP